MVLLSSSCNSQDAAAFGGTARHLRHSSRRPLHAIARWGNGRTVCLSSCSVRPSRYPLSLCQAHRHHNRGPHLVSTRHRDFQSRYLSRRAVPHEPRFPQSSARPEQSSAVPLLPTTTVRFAETRKPTSILPCRRAALRSMHERTLYLEHSLPLSFVRGEEPTSDNRQGPILFAP